MARRTARTLPAALAGLVPLAVAGALGGGAATALAGPLEEVLARTYLESPRLAEARASLRAADEAVPMALAARRPGLTSRTSVGVAAQDSSRGAVVGAPVRQSLTFAQALHSGGEAGAATARAESLVLAERARLAEAEQRVLMDAVAAFTGVAGAQALLERARENERRLDAQLAATRDRIRFGDLTKTDLAQAEARQAGASAERVAAEGELAAAEAGYEEAVGEAPGPGPLALPEPPEAGPGPLEDALAQARGGPAAQAARAELAAAEAEVALARSAFRPRLALTGEVGYVDEPSSYAERQGTASLGATLQVPLYQGGGEHARLRQARELREGRARALDGATRAAAAAASAAHHGLRTAAARIRALQRQADAAAFALDGVRQEALAGARTVLDVLDAESELYRAEAALIRARREEVLAAYRLRAATGRLTAEALGLSVQGYDATAHYRDVRNRWFGLGAVGSRR